jgi:hypothetical protein
MLIGTYIAFLLVFGITCLAVPRQIQRLAEWVIERGPTRDFSPLRNFVASKGYLWQVRAAGLIALLMGTVMLLALGGPE